MDLQHNTLMRIPPQPPILISPNFPLKIILPITMNDPRIQFSHKFDHNYDNPFAHDHARVSQSNGSVISNSNDQEFVQFRPDFHHLESTDSGVCSPPLWKSSSPTAAEPLLSSHWSLSPNSRLQAIARGQTELMEMVKAMPESCYELSLKDLVEHHQHKVEAQAAQNVQQRGVMRENRLERERSEKSVVRVESFENKRLFLKMVFPFALQSKKKKSSVSSSSGRVSPKPEAAKGGGGDGYWGKKLSGSRDSSSSSGRSYGSGRNRNGLLTGCWPFFHSRTNKSVE